MVFQGRPPSGLTAGPLTAPRPPGVPSSRKEKRQVVRGAADAAGRAPRAVLRDLSSRQEEEPGPAAKCSPCTLRPEKGHTAKNTQINL